MQTELQHFALQVRLLLTLGAVLLTVVAKVAVETKVPDGSYAMKEKRRVFHIFFQTVATFERIDWQ